MLVEAVFKSSFGFTYVLFGALVALYHVNDVFRVTVNVISDRSGFVCSVECVLSLSVRYVFAIETVFFRKGMSHGAGCVAQGCKVEPSLEITEVTAASISYNGCSFKDVVATGG